MHSPNTYWLLAAFIPHRANKHKPGRYSRLHHAKKDTLNNDPGVGFDYDSEHHYNPLQQDQLHHTDANGLMCTHRMTIRDSIFPTGNFWSKKDIGYAAIRKPQ